MSYDLRDIREISNNKLTKFVNRLAKRVAAAQNAQQTEKLENKEDIYSAAQMVKAVIKFHSLIFSKKFELDTQYFPTYEPDGDKVVLWIRGHNMGNDTPDLSLFNHTVNIFGEPILVDGSPFDDGIATGGTKSIALRFNRPTSPDVNEEDINITDSPDIQIAPLTTGVSYFFRVKIYATNTEGGLKRTLLMKRDDATPSNGVHIFIDPANSRLVFFIKKGGTLYKKETGIGAITTDTVLDIWCTYAVSGNVQHIYINNVDQTLSDSSYTEFWYPSTTFKYILLMSRGEAGGHVYGDLYDFRIYNEQVVSAAEVGYMYTNKWTIYDIPFGQVMVTDYYSTYEPEGAPGYDSVGYDSAGYDT